MDARTVRVELGPRSYDIEIGTDILDNIGEFITQRLTVSHVVMITDEHVEPLHAERVANGLVEFGIEVDVIVVNAGESIKSTDTATQLWEKLLELKADRKTVVVALGGGVIGDLAGFVAASYVRGLPFFQIPTTLLADVDSSVGGKVGVNLPGAKNMVGAFWQPRGVLIDTALLATLPDREYRAGLAEVVKYGVIMDAEFFAYLEQHTAEILARDPEVLRTIIARSCQLKAEVVSADEHELTGRRAILNYGHTFGHAIEAVTRYSLYLHGEAISIGMLCASRLAERLGYIPAEITRRQHQLLSKLGLPTAVEHTTPKDLIEAMSYDKKVQFGQLRFVLPVQLGKVDLFGEIAHKDIVEAICPQGVC